jgi:hypothetical protein
MNIAIKRSFLRILNSIKVSYKRINNGNTGKGILIAFVPFGTLLQSVAPKSDQPSAVSWGSMEI